MAEEDANASDIGDDLSEEETPNLPEEDATASDVEGDLNEEESTEEDA
jgi:hypothetical protein